MKAIRLWYRTFRAMITWIRTTRMVYKMIEGIPVENRGEAIKTLRQFESHIGNNVMTLIGVYPLDDSWYFTDEEIDDIIAKSKEGK